MKPQQVKQEQQDEVFNGSKSNVNYNDDHNPFVALPMIRQSSILAGGFVLFLISYIWPPLVLAVTYATSLFIIYSFRTTDDALERRKLYKQFTSNPPSPTVKEILTLPDNVHTMDFYWSNSRGMALKATIMTPRDQSPKAVVCFCHGFGDSVSFYKRRNNARLVQHGVAVIAIEYEGHGQSDGPSGLIYDWNQTVQDVIDFARQVTSCQQFSSLKVFLMGESMGGALAYCAQQRAPDVFTGGVLLVAPMCKISDSMKPPEWVISLFLQLAGPRGTQSSLGYLPIAPTKASLNRLTHSNEEMSRLLSTLPTGYDRNPRLATARECFLATMEIEASLQTFDAPFLVLHGKDDRVTDPMLSQALYDISPSKDKSIRLYSGMWHCITSDHELDTDRVLKDCIDWIHERI